MATSQLPGVRGGYLYRCERRYRGPTVEPEWEEPERGAFASFKPPNRRVFDTFRAVSRLKTGSKTAENGLNTKVISMFLFPVTISAAFCMLAGFHNDNKVLVLSSRWVAL